MVPTPLNTRSLLPTPSRSSSRSSNRTGSFSLNTISGSTANPSDPFSAAMVNPSLKIPSVLFVGHLTTISTIIMAAMGSSNAKSVGRPLSPARLSHRLSALYALTAATPSSLIRTGSFSASINASTPGAPSTFTTSPGLIRTICMRITVKTSISCTTSTGNSRWISSAWT
ncbi:hypothetical protein SDC9_186392 [bioreactor metagenome]|uniref:Uncharacterized protein n=1 Tax=bioreactor metagenome TaxID=1076179 RepID=A0A645HIT2_9ZZZZ